MPVVMVIVVVGGVSVIGMKLHEYDCFERIVLADLTKPALLGPTVDGYSCVGTEVRGTKDRKRVEYLCTRRQPAGCF